MNAAPMPQPAPAADRQWLVHCSTERTLVARQYGGEVSLVKLFEQGSLVDAEHEAELARTLAQPGVVAYTGAGLDPVTNKPCVTMEFFAGTNLEQWVAQRGPMSARRAARLIAQLARVLHDFHTTPRRAAPFGVVHRDVKPANIFLTSPQAGVDTAPTTVVLIDLEHATPLEPQANEPPSAGGFTGGTHGYSPPEAYLGAHPSPAFDVFGLGATLFFVLTGSAAFPDDDQPAFSRPGGIGQPRMGLLAGRPVALQALLTRCLAFDPSRRPKAAELIDTLDAFLADRSPGDEALEHALQAIHAADFAAAAARLAAVAATPLHDAGRHRALAGLAQRRADLLRRMGGTTVWQALGADDPDANHLIEAARTLAADLPRLSAFLRRFPRHAAALARRQAMLADGHRLLEEVLPEVSRLKLRAKFAPARELLGATIAAATALGRVPGGLSLPGSDPGHLPGPLLRNPARILQRAELDLERAEVLHGGLIARLHAAETELDLAVAGSVAEEITAIYSGASEIAAATRDRLHRLAYYVQRLAAPQRLLEQLADLLGLSDRGHRLAVVSDLIHRCRAPLVAPTPARAKGGVRALLDIVEQLLEDFPHTEHAVGPAAAALRAAMESITEQAWTLIADAKRKLQAIPVPIRPVQNLLNRIDGIRMLESFLDLPEHSRARLQDEIERLRMRLDQARTTRDNIARGAQEAMDRGHLTTALFDIERAVDQFEDESEEGTTGAPLSDQLEEAKRRKSALDQATVENHRLAARYVELLDDDDSGLAERLAILEERAAVLDQLVQALGSDRGSHYKTDLREVVMQLIQERAESGERRLDHAESPEARLEIVDATLQDLLGTVNHPSMSTELTGRARRVIDHWQHKRGEAQLQIEQRRQATAAARQRAQRVRWLRATAGLLLVTVLILVYDMAIGNARASATSGPTIPALSAPLTGLQRSADGDLRFASADAYRGLGAFAFGLDAGDFARRADLVELDLPGCAQRLVAQLARFESAADDGDWASSFQDSLRWLDRALMTMDQRIDHQPDWRALQQRLVAFGRQAHGAGLSQFLVRHPQRDVLQSWSRATSDFTCLGIEAAELTRISGLLR